MRDQLLEGRYRLVRELGEGGMGQVWEAQDETLGRPVAVKLISRLAGDGSHSDESRARFLREARITAQLQHPNIVTIHDLGETGTKDRRVPFLVMERVRGEGLDKVLSRGAVALLDAARWGTQICEALDDAHKAGVIHRDIKPSNILITPSGMVKVLDFGVARAADPYAAADRLTQTGFIVGTLPYMAPEQARGFPEPRSDLYALGCLLFELITGRPPFQASDAMGYLSAHLTQQPPLPSSVRKGIPSVWDDLVLILLRKEPAQRYPNAADLAQALRQLDRAPQPALSTDVSTPPPTMPVTTPLPTAVSTSGGSSAPPQPQTASTSTPAHLHGPPMNTVRATLERFGPPVFLCLFFNSLVDYWFALDVSRGPVGGLNMGRVNFLVFLIIVAVIWVFTAALTPRSRGLMRGTGYAVVAVFAVGLVVDVVFWMQEPRSTIAASGSYYTWGGPLPIYVGSVLTVAAYCYRDIKTRRARSVHSRSDSGNASVAGSG
ncbi:serine/threonine-protein kinase [Nocardiopsis trehalosi]|uniref:serine/threonine-protein kinase n=1 Tax=Nocardiopsis trehalosi TaxID=109329 RepID=UPI000AF1ADEF|nr:serine/threonine-protein kinase [Nocardiopsis trehalosi]